MSIFIVSIFTLSLAAVIICTASERSLYVLNDEDIQLFRSSIDKSSRRVVIILAQLHHLRQSLHLIRCFFFGVSAISYVFLSILIKNTSVSVTLFTLLFLSLLCVFFPWRISVKHASIYLKFMSPMLYRIIRTCKPFLITYQQNVLTEEYEDTLHTSENIEKAIDTRRIDATQDEKEIVKGILKFGVKTVQDIMTPRHAVVTIQQSANYQQVLDTILSEGYSRIPVIINADNYVGGILYIKDLLPHLTESYDFDWQILWRKPYFVPESKMLDDLLHEFQQQKVHIAIVVDEYGTMSGIVTMEDLLEEIVGEINDEFDEDSHTHYVQIDSENYIFDGKTPLEDFYSALKIDHEIFELQAEDSETLAGLVLSLFNAFPKQHATTNFGNISFEILQADARRINKVKVHKTSSLKDSN